MSFRRLPLLVLGVACGLVIAVPAVDAAGVGAGLAPQQEAWPEPDPDLLERARALLREVPLIDGHNDLPTSLLEEVDGVLERADIAMRQEHLSADIPRLREGMVGGQFFSVFTESTTMYSGTALHEAMRELDVARRFIDRYDDFELARTAADVERIFADGRIAAMLGLEGGHMIENSLANLRVFHDLGIRYMTLTHFLNTDWADSATDAPVNGGLSPFGEEVVRELNRLGIFVDLSHVSAETMHDALRVTEAPVIYSHSGARAVNVHPRNVPDDVLRRLAGNGGVVMVDFIAGYTPPTPEEWRSLVDLEAAAFYANAALGGVDPVWSFRRREHREELQVNVGDPAEIERRMAAWDSDNPAPRGTLGDVADHIEHIVAIAGIDHVGLGSDYYDAGETSMAYGLEDVTRFPYLIAELLARGWSDGDVKKLAGLNVLRAMREMESTSARLRAERGPSMVGIDQ